MSTDLKGKCAVVTGGNRGIGYAIAEALASHGCSVVLTSRTAASAEDAADRLAKHGGRMVPFQCDVRDEVSVQRLFSLVGDEFKHLDFLINNAGIFGPAVPVDEIPIDGWRETLETNLTGPLLCTKNAVPLMAKGSVVVNNLSVAAKQVFPKSAAYSASKHGLLALTDVMREDLRGKGIRVIALMPGATNTEIWNQFWPGAPREKMMPASDIAHAVLNALLRPVGTSVDEIHIMPAGGLL